MDLQELLNFQPSRASKRPLEVLTPSASASPSPSPSHKQPRRSHKYPPTPGHSLGQPNQPIKLSDISSPAIQPTAAPVKDIPVVENTAKSRKVEEEKLLKLLAAAEEEDDLLPAPQEEVTISSLKKQLLSLNKKSTLNQQLRVKYCDEPTRFMESELELYGEIQQLMIVSTCPDSYPQLIELDFHNTLLQLLGHENADIAMCVADLLREMLDVDPLNEGVEGAELLSQQLLEGQVMSLLVSLLGKLDEKNAEESQGIHNILGLVENMAEFQQQEVLNSSGEQGLLLWLLKRIRVRTFEANKLYTTEILSILLQNNTGNQQLLGAKNGIDCLLEAVSLYKRREPVTGDEVEMVENLFDCLCMSLTHAPNRVKFLEGEGLQLMILLLKDRKMCRRSSLKVLNHALQGREGIENCVKFIELYGLRTIFPFFMLPNKTCKKNAISGMEQDEHVISILLSLIRNVQGQQKDRVLAKFAEKDMEKSERLVELHFFYKQRSSVTDSIISKEIQKSDDAPDEAEIYMKRLDGGLFVLQQIDFIIVEVMYYGHVMLRERIHKLFEQQKVSILTVKNVVMEFLQQMGEGLADGGSTDSVDKKKLLEMVNVL